MTTRATKRRAKAKRLPIAGMTICKNQHAECCNASFAYWEYLPTCRSCSRELCGEASCVVAGSEQESDGRKTYSCK